MACDTKGAEAAKPWIRAAHPEHPSLIDYQHRVPELFSTRNVPSAFWIDEDGVIVRANDPVFARRRSPDTEEVSVNETYLQALRDLVGKGSKSIYLQDEAAKRSRMMPPKIETSTLWPISDWVLISVKLVAARMPWFISNVPKP